MTEVDRPDMQCKETSLRDRRDWEDEKRDTPGQAPASGLGSWGNGRDVK